MIFSYPDPEVSISIRLIINATDMPHHNNSLWTYDVYHTSIPLISPGSPCINAYEINVCLWVSSQLINWLANM